jgi:uncharacterized repeat protein (TIGR03843 family)
MPDELLQQAFQNGEITLKGQFMLGSNYTFLATITHEGQNFKGVYKPTQGEQPLWDFPESTLALREVAAYLVSEIMSLGLVPYTIIRADGPYGTGSLQQYIEYNPNYHYFNFKDEDKPHLRVVAFFDLLTNNADRKGSHVFFEKRTHHLYAIDHGLCFHEEDKLRTVIWDFAGEPIPDELLAALERLRSALTTRDLHADLSACLSADEIAALDLRAESMLEEKTFPFPPRNRRAYPYPPL